MEETWLALRIMWGQGSGGDLPGVRGHPYGQAAAPMQSSVGSYGRFMYLEPTNETGRLLLERQIPDRVTMLNLLRFREQADYSSNPELAPAEPITGRAAYDVYTAHTKPFLEAAGGKVLYVGEGGHFLIGPVSERWDMVMLVEHASVAAFMGMARNAEYLSGLGHRTAALEDSRLLPATESK